MSSRLAYYRLPLAVTCALFTLVVAALHFTEERYSSIEQKGRDWLQTNGAARRARTDPRLVFLGIDDASKTLDTLFEDDLAKSPTLTLMKQGFPWNREVYAQIIERLTEAGARAVIFDMIFPNPRDGDEAFRAALDKYHDRVVIGVNLKEHSEDADAEQSTLTNKPSLILPTEQLEPPKGRESWLGYVNVHPDSDRIVRRFRYRTTLLEFFGIPPSDQDEEIFSLAARGLQKAGLTELIPAGHRPSMPRISEQIHPRSLHEIFVPDQWEAPPYRSGQFFQNKIVLIGASGNEAEDRLQTPAGIVLGPMIHLSAMNAALKNDYLHETTRWENFLLICAGGLTAWMLGAWVPRPLLRLFLIIAAALAYYGLSQILFNFLGWLPILISPVLVLAGSGFTYSTWEHARDRKERKKMRQTLERYVGHDVVRELLDNPATYLNALGGVRKTITILFSDVRGFTTRTERADPHVLVTQLNEYFEEMVAIVFGHHGTLDKFIGDAVMAHWGSMVSEGEATDAARAVTTVLKMREALIRLNKDWQNRGMETMRVGYGINHGDAIVGNLGCEAKMEVSVIGDAVNLGSRLEGATKTYKIDICLGGSAAELVRDSFILRSVDLIIVQGKTEPVEIFTVLGARNEAEPAWLARHEQAMKLYRTGEFAHAATVWRDVLADVPGDGLSRVLLDRCLALHKNPPTEPWTGVYEMQTK